MSSLEDANKAADILIAEALKVKEQRDELLAIAEEYLAFLYSEWHAFMSEDDFDSDQTVVKVHAAIKKAKS